MTQKEIFDFVDSQKTAFIASVDEDGFPNMKAMLAPREKRRGNLLLHDKYIIHACEAVS